MCSRLGEEFPKRRAGGAREPDGGSVGKANAKAKTKQADVTALSFPSLVHCPAAESDDSDVAVKRSAGYCGFFSFFFSLLISGMGSSHQSSYFLQHDSKTTCVKKWPRRAIAESGGRS